MSYEMVDNNPTTTATTTNTEAGTVNDVTGATAPVTGADTTGATDAPVITTEGNPAGDALAETEKDEPAEGTTEVPEATGEVEYYWGGEAVEIEVADDVQAALSEKGLDAKAIAAELYAKGGEFKLSDETKQKLYDAFGKFSVDAYLSGVKAQNEMYMLNSQRDMEKAEQANTERYQAVAQEIGGDEGWNRLEAYALSALSDAELTAFNEVMNSGNQYLQAYAVRELESRRLKAEGDDKVSLIPGSAPAGAEGGPMTRQEYMAEMVKLGATYRHDKEGHARAQAALDARRRAGMAKGI